MYWSIDDGLLLFYQGLLLLILHAKHNKGWDVGFEQCFPPSSLVECTWFALSQPVGVKMSVRSSIWQKRCNPAGHTVVHILPSLPLPSLPYLPLSFFLLSSPSPFSLSLLFFSSLILSSFSSILPLLLFPSIYYIPPFFTFTFFPPSLPSPTPFLPPSLSSYQPTHPSLSLSLPFRTPSLPSISSNSSPLSPSLLSSHPHPPISFSIN